MKNYKPLPTNQSNIVSAYVEMIKQRINEQTHSAYLLSVMFNNISGGEKAKLIQMERLIERTYARHLTHVFRYPLRVPAYDLPMWFGLPDKPVAKGTGKRKMNIGDTLINDGLHYHLVAAQPIHSRMDCHFSDFVTNNQNRLIGSTNQIARIDCIPIDNHEVGKTTRYALKSLTRRRYDSDNILLLPRIHTEMS